MPKEPVYPIEKNENSSSKKKYLVVDFNEEISASSSVKDKRKIVCIERNKKNELTVENYDNGQFKKAFKKVQAERREIYLVLYVKDSEQAQCTKESRKILELRFDLSDADKVDQLKNHFKESWKNFREFNHYALMKRSYDEKTGEHITNVLADLTAKKDTIHKLYKEIEGEFEGHTSTLESILQEVDEKYKEATENHQHLEVGTYSLLATELGSCVSKFNAELKRLRKEDSDVLQKDKCISLKNEIEALQKECRGAIPSDTLCTEELVNKKNKINTEIALLLQMVEELGNSIDIPIDQAIKGLEKKFNDVQTQLASLKVEIEGLSKTQEKNTQSVQNMPAETNSLFDELNELLSEIENHQTDKAKTAVKEELVNKIKGILSQRNETSSKDLNEAIEKAKEFVEANEKTANIYTGGVLGKFFGKGYSVLGELMNRLKDLLNEILTVLSKIHPNDEKLENACSVSPK